jgi:SAM-dependent methyltransferase
MDSDLESRLAALPRLDLMNAYTTASRCKICGGAAAFFDVTDFWKGCEFYPFGMSGIPVPYHRCETCGFMFTNFFDDWTSEDFRRHIYNDQYVLVDGEYTSIRPERTAIDIAEWLRGYESARILDYGSGTGLFAKHMYDRGFEQVVSYDPFSAPTRPDGLFDIITCFEVIEHSTTPLDTLRDIASLLSDDGCVLLGQCLQPRDIEAVRCNWWYCAPRNGHVSLFTNRALSRAVGQYNLLFHAGDGLHAFSRPGSTRFSAIANRIGVPAYDVVLGAPQDGKLPFWHGLEEFSGRSSRWMASPEFSWTVEIPSGKGTLIRIRIPFVAEVHPGFAEQSKIFIDGAMLKTQIVDRSLVAEVEIEQRSVIEVMLQTPDPIAPSDFKDSADRRPLGLAIPL